MEDKNELYIVAIVGLIAVVALVVLVLGVGTGERVVVSDTVGVEATDSTGQVMARGGGYGICSLSWSDPSCEGKKIFDQCSYEQNGDGFEDWGQCVPMTSINMDGLHVDGCWCQTNEGRD